MDELLAEPREEYEANPIDMEEENDDEEQNEEPEDEPEPEVDDPNNEVTDDDVESSASSRRELPARNRVQPERLTYTQMKKKIVRFAEK